MDVAVALHVDAVLVDDLGDEVERGPFDVDGAVWAQILGGGLDGGDQLDDVLEP